MVQINFARHLWGLPVWAWVLLGAVLLIEYGLPRRDGARTRSLLEGLANIIAWVFGRVPMLGPFLRRFGGPPSAVTPLEPVTPTEPEK